MLKKIVMTAVVAAVLAMPSLSQNLKKEQRRFTHTSLTVPGSTDAGSWDGTWWYLSKDARMAIWIRNGDKSPEVKFQYMNMMAPEGFVTDWKGVAEYEIERGEGRFELHVTEGDAREIKGTWNWVLLLGEDERKQRGKITIYRTGSGRFLTIAFDEFELSVAPRGKERWNKADQMIGFRKASKRLVRWEELPF